MPIKCDIPLRNLTQAEFGPLAYSVLGDVYRIHNDLGRYFDEQIYKRALGRCRPDVRLEEPIQISFRTFHTKCKLDVVVADGGVFEFKAVEVFSPRHKAQLIHYLHLVGLSHGLLVNVRTEKVEHLFVNAPLTRDERFRFVPEQRTWDSGLPSATFFRETLLDLLADWGTGLELPLYEEALTHFLGGQNFVVRPAEVQFQEQVIWRQDFRHTAEHVAFKLTAFEDEDSLDNFEKHVDRLLVHTSLDAVIWANIGRRVVTFATLKSKRGGGRK